jgi:general secretion pathway protein G
MSKMRKLFKGGENGFTLIELLVVIAVLGILAAIAVPRLGGVTDKARMTEASSAMGSIKTALEMYSVENEGAYPASSDFNGVIDDYLDDFSGGTYEANLDWTVSYTGTDPEGGDFDIQMTHDAGDGDTYVVSMSHTSSGGYNDVTTEISN